MSESKRMERIGIPYTEVIVSVGAEWSRLHVLIYNYSTFVQIVYLTKFQHV